MILFTARAIKILLALAFMAAGVLWLRGKEDKSQKQKKGKKKTDQKMGRQALVRLCAIWIVLAGAFAAAANAVAGQVPPLKDVVVLTALGEKNEASSGEEVFFNGFTVDGETVPASKPVEGKWFWKGNEALCWRIESDPRQPEGMTRSITVEVPVGWSRMANFAGNTGRGLVQVKTADGEQVVDTYAGSETERSAVLGRSTTPRLIWNQVRYLAVYALVLLALCCLGMAAAKWLVRDTDRSRLWLERNAGKLVYGVIALAAFVFMFHYADKTSFWGDEILQVGWCSGGIKSVLSACLNLRDATPPLYGILISIWYRIVPFGEEWVLLPSICFSVLAVYVLGLIGEWIGDKYTGIAAAVFCATSTVVWGNQAYELRTYALLLLFAAFTIYLHIKREEKQLNRRYHILYSLSLLCLGMSHYFGMLACAGFFVFDFCLFIKRKIRWTMGLDYVVPGAVCLAWLAAVVLKNGANAFSLNAYSAVTYSSVDSVLRWISGNNKASYYLLLAGISVGIALPFGKNDDMAGRKRRHICFFACMIVLTLAAVAFYGIVINPGTTMWMERYFTELIPFAILLMANTVILCAAKLGAEWKRIICVFFAIVMSMSCLINASEMKSYNPYRESADWIYQQIDNIYNDDTMIIIDGDDTIVKGYQNYYITRCGQRDALNVQSTHAGINKLPDYNRVYFLLCYYKTPRVNILSRIEAELEKNFELETNDEDLRVRVYVRKGDAL